MTVGNSSAVSFQKERTLKAGLGNSRTKLAQATRVKTTPIHTL